MTSSAQSLYLARSAKTYSFPDMSPVLATSQAFEPICFELDDASAFGTEAVHNCRFEGVALEWHITSLFQCTCWLLDVRSVDQRARCSTQQSGDRSGVWQETRRSTYSPLSNGA